VNYISALEYLPAKPAFDRYWPANLHLVGKDILTTHAIYWSAMLMALELPLPQTIFAHGWWTVNGEKMSKSRGNVVDPYEMVKDFEADAFRYFLLREVPFGQDGDFSKEALTSRFNSDLADGLGNLLNRTLTMIELYCKGEIPEDSPEGSVENLLENQIGEMRQIVEDCMTHLQFNRALEAIWSMIQTADQYIDGAAPWALAKKPEKRPELNRVLYRVAETLRVLGLHLYPFMPEKAEDLLRQLGLALDLHKTDLCQTSRWGGLRPGTAIAKGKSLFPKLLSSKMSGEATLKATATVIRGGDKVTDTAPPSQPAVTSPGAVPAQSTAVEQITIEDFQKVQLKVARVLNAERVPKSEKLIKLQVDLGGEQRQIVAGIGKKYEPESLVGRRVVIVANLKPAKLMGVESQGMVLAAGDKEVGGLVTILEEVDPGTKVK
jgi:methionyl-tRNA synthetase